MIDGRNNMQNSMQKLHYAARSIRTDLEAAPESETVIITPDMASVIMMSS